MNREIKFKAKRKDNNQWIEGTGIVRVQNNTYSTNNYELVKSVNYDELDYFQPSYDTEEIDINTLCQYTGLKDKNGVEIYENDIISATEHLTNGYIGIGEVDLYYEVNYIDRLSKYALNPRIINGKYNSNNFELDMFHYKAEDIEVIGNIFDKGVE